MTARAGRLAALACALAACGDGGRERGGGAPAEPAGYLGPTLALEAPARGAMLDLAERVALRGRACDAEHGITGATLAGAPLVLEGAGPCRTFAAELTPRVGLEVVRGEVVNDAGERGTLAQAFLAAPAWFDADGTGAGAGAAAGRGLLVGLGQALVDDGDRSTLDDVASVVQAVIAAQDLDAAVGAQRIASPDANGDGRVDTRRYRCGLYTVTNRRTGYAAWKDGPLRHGGIEVERLTLEDGGLSARVTVRRLRVPFGVTGYVDSGCLGDAQDTVHGDVAIGAIVVDARAAVVPGPDGAPRLTIRSTAAALHDLDVDIALGRLVDWTGLGSLIGDGIEAVVRGPIQAGIRDGVRDALEARLARLLPALAEVGGTVTLPPALGGGVLDLEAGLDLADFTPARALVGLRVRVSPRVPAPAHAGARGAMRLGGALPDMAALEGDALAVGLLDDALNQLLHAVWRAGAFDRAGLVIEGGLDGTPGTRAVLSLAAALPPVVVARRDGGGLEVGWGDVGFDLALEGPRGTARVKGWLSIVIGLEGLGVDPAGGTFRPVLAGEPEVAVELTSVDWDHLPTTRARTEGLVAGLLRSQLPALVEQALRAAPLPAIDLGRLDPSLPPIRVGLDVPRDLRLERYSLVAGGVAVTP